MTKEQLSKLKKDELIDKILEVQNKEAKVKDIPLEDVLYVVQQELNAPKNLYNKFGKYYYRNAEGILTGVKEILKRFEGVSIICKDNIIEVGDYTFVESYAYLVKGMQRIGTRAQAGIERRKGMDLAQVFGASSSYARKYALNALFGIDDVKDADTMDKPQPVEKEDNRAWLNEGTQQFTEAQKYLANGGSIEAIEKKYKISKAVKQKLI